MMVRIAIRKAWTLMTGQARISLTRNELTKMRSKAIRRGIWFKVLSGAERAYMGLAIRVVERVRSLLLAKVLTSILKKLLSAMESRVARIMREIGHSLAQKLSRIAQKWGNKPAIQWTDNHGFIQYLTVNHINTPAAFKV
ncbi:MAG: hypothetical protein JSV12_09200 [Candidatus Bathyarchaeota archaeon]|nr:MAG: hypothetical protein JSV12_09200 [Candidatus Bathyarchaeota archaeon]